MTLVLDGMPSAGGPRSRRSRAGRAWDLPCLASFSLSLEASLVMSFRASVGAGASAAPAALSAEAAPSPSFFSS
jgi:hypothetical protein